MVSARIDPRPLDCDPFDVFISYPHQDKVTADAACAKLEAEGIRCWIAPRDIAPGADWEASILGAINNCSFVVLIFFNHTNHSDQLGREVKQAFDGGKFVVPFRIENVAPVESLQQHIRAENWVDAFTHPLDRHLKVLASVMKALVEAAAPFELGDDPLWREVEKVETCDDCKIFALLGRKLLGWGKVAPDVSQFPICYRPEGDGYVERCPWAELKVTALPLTALPPDKRKISDMPRVDYFTQPQYEDGGLTARVKYGHRLNGVDASGRRLPPYLSEMNLTLKKIDGRWNLISQDQGLVT
jgi:TIR domain